MRLLFLVSVSLLNLHDTMNISSIVSMDAPIIISLPGYECRLYGGPIKMPLSASLSSSLGLSTEAQYTDNSAEKCNDDGENAKLNLKKFHSTVKITLIFGHECFFI